VHQSAQNHRLEDARDRQHSDSAYHGRNKWNRPCDSQETHSAWYSCFGRGPFLKNTLEVSDGLQLRYCEPFGSAKDSIAHTISPHGINLEVIGRPRFQVSETHAKEGR
jgi:hypothetical protein